MDNLFSENRLIFLSPPGKGPKPGPKKQETHEAVEKPSLKLEKTPEALKVEVERTRDSIKTLREHIKKRAERNPALKKILARLDQIDDAFYRMTQSSEGVKWNTLQKIQTMIYKPGSELNKQRIAVAKNILEKSVGDFRNGNVARLLDLALLLKSDGIPIKSQGLSVERRGHHMILKNGNSTTTFKIVLQGDNWTLNEVRIGKNDKTTETALGKKKTSPYVLGGLKESGGYTRPFYSNRETATKDVYDYSHMAKTKPKQKVVAKRTPEKQRTQAEIIGAQLTQAIKLIQEGKSLNAEAKKGLSTIATLLRKADEAGNPTSLNYKNVKISLTYDGEHLRMDLPKKRGKGVTVNETAIYSIHDKAMTGRETTKKIITREIVHKRWEKLIKKVNRLKPGEQVSITVGNNRMDIKKTKTGINIYVDGVLNRNLNMASLSMVNIDSQTDYKIVTAKKVKVAAKPKPERPYKFKKGTTGNLVQRAAEGIQEGSDAQWKLAMKKSLDAKIKQLSSHSTRLRLAKQIINVLQTQMPNVPKNKIYSEAGRRVAVFITHLKGARSRIDSQTPSQTRQDINRAIALLPVGNKKEGPLYAFVKDLQPTEIKKAAPKKAVAAKPGVSFEKVALKDWPQQIQTNVANVLRQLLKYPNIAKAYNRRFNSVASILLKKVPGSQYLHALTQHKAVRKLFQDIAKNSDVKKFLRRYNEKALLGQIKKLALAPYPPEPKKPTATEKIRIAQLKKRREKMKKWAT